MPAGVADKGKQVTETPGAGLEGSMDGWEPDARGRFALGLPLEAELAANGGLDKSKLNHGNIFCCAMNQGAFFFFFFAASSFQCIRLPLRVIRAQVS